MGDLNLLAFDLGAESGRAIVGTIAAGRLGLKEVHRFANPSGQLRGHRYWNLLGQWEELMTGLRRAAALRPGSGQAAGGDIAGLGVDTWGVDFGLLDSRGDLLANPFQYRDSRTDGVMEKAFARVSRERIFAATGIQLMQINTLFQLLATRDLHPHLLERAKALLFTPDLFNYLFTGRRTSEYSIATTSQMYDPCRGCWATELLNELGLPTAILQPVIPSATVVGPLLKEVADECGIGAIPVIAPGCHDTASAVAAVPAQGQSWCYISSGTWSLMGVELAQPIINEQSLRYNFTNEGGVSGTIRFLKNIMGMWLVQECRRQWSAEGHEYSYAQLTEMAAAATPMRSLVNPDDGPFLSPGQMPQKIQQFCKRTGQPEPTSPAQFVRCCLDSLALVYRWTLERLEEMTGRRLGVIHIVGGGSQNELLNQMTADACGRSVAAGPVEATAMGNILAQAMALGQLKNLAEVRAVVAASVEVKRYEPRDTGPWDAGYSRFREIAG